MLFWIIASFLMFGAHSDDVHIVMQDGTNYRRQTQLRCYNKDYNLTCNSGHIVPVKSTFGLKDPKLQHQYNCSNGQHLPYPEQCCQKNVSSDCFIETSKDLIHLVKICGLKQSCTKQKAGWTSINSQSNVKCRYKNADIGTITTQYVDTEYICVSESADSTLCPSQTNILTGKGLFLKSENYPNFVNKGTGFHCNCSISVAKPSTVSVYTVDLRMCNEGKQQCGQELYVYDGGRLKKRLTTSSIDDDNVAFKKLSETSGDMKLRFRQNDGKIDFHVWLYFYAEGKDMTMTCTPADTFTTTTITTTIATTTIVHSKATSQNMSTSSTVKTTPTTTPTTTTPTTTTTIQCPAGCVQDKCAAVKEKLKSFEMKVKYNKKFDYIAMGGAGLGGILLASFVACIHSRKQRKRIKKRQTQQQYTQQQQIRVQNNIKMKPLAARSLNFENRSVISVQTVDESDSVSQVGRPKPKRQRKTSPPILKNTPSRIEETPESKEDLVNKIAMKLKDSPEFEKALLNLPLELADDEEAPKEIKDVLRRFEIETLTQTLIDIDERNMSEKM